MGRTGVYIGDSLTMAMVLDNFVGSILSGIAKCNSLGGAFIQTTRLLMPA